MFEYMDLQKLSTFKSTQGDVICLTRY